MIFEAVGVAKVARYAMLDTVAASWMDFIALSEQRLAVAAPGTRPQSGTLILRFLHLRQPARDFRCDRRGGIAPGGCAGAVAGARWWLCHLVGAFTLTSSSLATERCGGSMAAEAFA